MRIDGTGIRIVLFFTRGVSLQTWRASGVLDRETALYRRLAKFGVQTTFVTYGDVRDLRVARDLPGIRVLCNWFGLPDDRYERWMTWVFAPWFWKADLFKSNQVNGADVALWAARRWGKPVVARAGYLLKPFADRVFGDSSPESRRAAALEAFVLRHASHVVLTTPRMRDTVCAAYGVASGQVTVIPNYVDTNAFRPVPAKNMDTNRPIRLGYVGRLRPEKNLENLVRAVGGLSVHLSLVGAGDGETALRELARGQKAEIEFLGQRRHSDLPGLMNSWDMFVLPSLIEGHPKALLEAMSCGLPVIATDVEGSRDVISHGVNGHLCGTGVEELCAAVRTVSEDEELRSRLGATAREYVVTHYSLDTLLDNELAVYQKVLV